MGFYKARNRFGIPSYFQRTGQRFRKSGESYAFMDYNERYFEKIDSPDKAYFLGLMASDGNISPRLTAARIALVESDSDILESFRTYLGKEPPKLTTKAQKTKFGFSRTQKQIVLSRKLLVEDLLNHGLTPNKSTTLKMSCDLKGFEKHFLRGVWDGDGSITERRFNVCSASQVFIEQIQELIYITSGRELPVKSEISKSGNFLFKISGYVKDASVIQSIYEDTNLAIQRKLFAYLEYWESRR